MSRQVKLIWDFRGPNAVHIAPHHAKHLDEFVVTEGIENAITGTEKVTEMHHIAYLIVEASLMDSLRKVLKPDRGQNYTP
jgi:hypothetical protein